MCSLGSDADRVVGGVHPINAADEALGGTRSVLQDGPQT
jgi:hypothetical protein